MDRMVGEFGFFVTGPSPCPPPGVDKKVIN